MIKIEDVIVPSKGTGKYFAIKCLNLDLNKSSEATPTFYWEVKTAVPYAIDEVQTQIPGEVILNGNLSMSSVAYSSWGNDDSYVINWALEQLGFVEVVEEPSAE
jgi:hypothetical protein